MVTKLTLLRRFIFCLLLVMGLSLAVSLGMILPRSAMAHVEPPGPRLTETISFPPGIGISPQAVAVDPATGYVYVASEFNNEVTIISGTRVITALVVGSGPVFVQVNPVNGYIYVVNKNSYDITVISQTTPITKVSYASSYEKVFPTVMSVDPKTGYLYLALEGDQNEVIVLDGTEIIAWLAVAPVPQNIGLNPTTGYLYVANSWANKLTVIQGTEIITAISLDGSPEAITMNPVTGYTYVTLPSADAVAVVSGTQVITILPVGDHPFDIVSHPQTSYVYVLNNQSDDVTIISGTQVVTTLPAGDGVVDIAAHPHTSYIYIPIFQSGQVMVISGTQVVTTLPVGNYPTRVEVNSQTDYVYVFNDSGSPLVSSALTVISGTRVVGTVPVGDWPQRIAVQPQTGYAYVINHGSDSVTVVEGLAAIASLSAGTFPTVIERNPANGYFYATDSVGDRIFVISGTTVIKTQSSGERPYDIAVNQANGLAYISNWEGHSISVISGTEVLTMVENIPSPSAVAVNSALGYIYIGNFFTDTVTILRGTTVISQVKAIHEPHKIEVNPQTGLAYVIGLGASMSVISGTQVIASPTLPSQVTDITFDRGSGHAYVTAGKGIAILDRTTLIAYLALGNRYDYDFRVIEANPVNGYIYAGEWRQNQIVVISGTQVIARLPAGVHPYDIEIDPGSGRVYVTHRESPEVVVISGTKVINTFSLDDYPPIDRWETYPSYPRDMAINPETGAVYIANFYHHTISVLELRPDFNLAPVPAAWHIRSGTVTTRTIELASQLGFSEAVTLTITGWPTGSVGMIEPNPVQLTDTVIVTAAVSARTPLGPYVLTLSGTSDGLIHTVNFPLLAFVNQASLPAIFRNYPSTPTPIPTTWPTPTPKPTLAPPLPTTPTPTATPFAPLIEFVTWHYNAEGDDAANLNDEYLVLRNNAWSGSLLGWWLTDRSGNRYAFPDVAPIGGMTFTVHTGFGTDTDTDLYWNSPNPIWDNEGDTAFLYDATGRFISGVSWGK